MLRSSAMRLDVAMVGLIACVSCNRDTRGTTVSSPATPTTPAPAFDVTALAIPDPPDLPAVPVVNECETFDLRNPACRSDPRMCLEGHAYCKCPDPPDANNPGCWAVMPCPSVPDRRILACRPKWPECPDPDRPDASNPQCPPKVIDARVTLFRTYDGQGVVTIGVGSNNGITKHWKATLLRADSNDALPNGEITIVRVDLRETVGKVRLSREVVRDNPRVRLVVP